MAPPQNVPQPHVSVVGFPTFGGHVAPRFLAPLGSMGQNVPVEVSYSPRGIGADHLEGHGAHCETRNIMD